LEKLPDLRKPIEEKSEKQEQSVIDSQEYADFDDAQRSFVVA
jgi:hypothetical protein